MGKGSCSSTAWHYRPLACAVDQPHCTRAHSHLGAINHVGVLQGDGEGQLQLVGEGVEGRQGSAGEEHAAHAERLQGAHADAAGEAPVAQRGVGHATLQSQGSTSWHTASGCWGKHQQLIVGWDTGHCSQMEPLSCQKLQ